MKNPVSGFREREDSDIFTEKEDFVMENTVLTAMKERRSIRKYKKEQISDEQLHAILEAAPYAPTGMGMQSPVMVVVQRPELIQKLSRLNAQVMGSENDPF